MVAMALPNDDVALEMEETEGFISQPDSPTKRNVSSSTSSSSSSSSFKHWTVALVLVIVCAGGGIAFVSYNSNNNNQSLENPNDASPNDVEQQWNTSIAEDDYGAGRYGPKDQIVRLERPLTQNQWDALTKEWGKWSFVDKQASTRPSPSFMDQFPNRDVPYDQFPKKAWQTDPVYLKDFLDEGLALVDRAMEAILAEYGSGKKHRPNLDLERRQNITFGIRWTNLTMTTNLGYPKGMLPPNGGWTTPKSFDGLVRRVLHAIMTQDTFTFILSGHSAAAGHGNLFKQSYSMQFHKVMEPVFALLGVKLTSRNLAHGGLGTLQSGMGLKDIFGPDIDILVWDSGMTEGRDSWAEDLLFRQSMVAGNRVPFFMGGSFAHLRDLYNIFDADVAQYGEAVEGLPVCETEEQSLTVPWAVRCKVCAEDRSPLCANKWLSNCWVPRDDVQPPTPQAPKPGSQVRWHPGWKEHQAVGRTMAFMTLRAIKTALTKWQSADNYRLPDEDWHVHDYYEHIREKARTEKGGMASRCISEAVDGGFLPEAFCTKPINARTEFTPRANPIRTSLQSIIKPDENGRVPHVATAPMLYTGPDVFNNYTAIPEGEIDVLAIVSNGRVYPEDRRDRRRRLEIQPGLGHMVAGEPAGYCDGTWNSECNRPATSNCLLSGHNDARGGILMNSYSGWLVMTLKGLKEGVIATKMETWHPPEELGLTAGWTSINNRGDARGLRRNEEEGPVVVNGLPDRELKYVPPEICAEFKFEFAINGQITSWDKEEFEKRNQPLQRVVEIQVLLNDTAFTEEPQDVELALRMTGCGASTKKTFSLTHVYWA